MRPRASAPPTVALYTVGQLPAYLLPTLTSSLADGLGLPSTQAGALGSTLLLASATAGLLLAGRVTRFGAHRLAPAGLGLLALGCALAATGPDLLPLAAALAVAGLGAGTATAVATTALAATPDPHRASVRVLLATSGTAAGLYLLLPQFGSSPAAPFTALALAAVATATVTIRPAAVLPKAPGNSPTVPATGTATAPAPRGAARSKALALTLAVPFWSMAQNALWGVSGQLGHRQAGLGESTLGLVFALALLGGLLGVTAAGALGSRIGRAVPIGTGTLVIAGCALLTATARGPAAFTSGELLWNLLHPLVLSHLLGLAATLDPSGRRAVQTSAASALGVACGPLVGAVLAGTAGYPGMGGVLAAVLVLAAVPLTLAARRTPDRGTAPTPVPAGRPTRRRLTWRSRAGHRAAPTRPAVRIPRQRSAPPATRPANRAADAGYALSSARNSAPTSVPDGSSLT